MMEPAGSYTAQWIPAPGLLFEAPETAGGIEHHIACQILPSAAGGGTGGAGLPPPPAPTVIDYQAQLSPAVSVQILSITASPTGVIVHSAGLAGLFGIDFIDYLRGGVVSRAASWEALPADAEQIIEFRPSKLTSRSYQLMITARLSNGDAVQAGYAIVIQQDWTAGRDRLKEFGNASSRKTG